MFKDKTEFLPSADVIIEEVGKFYNISVSDIKGQTRTKEIVLARQVAMYETRRLTSLSLPEIGQVFGGRDHTTIIHGAEKITNEMAKNDSLRNTVEILKKKIRPQ